MQFGKNEPSVVGTEVTNYNQLVKVFYNIWLIIFTSRHMTVMWQSVNNKQDFCYSNTPISWSLRQKVKFQKWCLGHKENTKWEKTCKPIIKARETKKYPPSKKTLQNALKFLSTLIITISASQTNNYKTK